MTDKEWEDAYYEAWQRDLMRQAYADADAEDCDPNYDGDACPHCGSDHTYRMEIIVDDPVIWACECAACGRSFEVVK